MFTWPWQPILDRLTAIETGQQKILAALGAIQQQEGSIMPTLDDVLNDVQSETTVVGSVQTLLTGLNQQLQAALAANDPAKVQEIMDQIDSQKASLAAAVAQNTPGGGGAGSGTGGDQGGGSGSGGNGGGSGS